MIEHTASSSRYGGLPDNLSDSTNNVEKLVTAKTALKLVLEKVPKGPVGVSLGDKTYPWSTRVYDCNGEKRLCIRIPPNFESLADSMASNVLFAAATLHPQIDMEFSTELIDSSEMVVVDKREDYAKGMLDALRDGAGTPIPPCTASGLYSQGYNWFATRSLVTHRNARFLRTSYKTPMILFKAKDTAWGEGLSPTVLKYLQTVRLVATKYCTTKPSNFAKNLAGVRLKEFKHKRLYESLAAFSHHEVSEMKNFMKTADTEYAKFCDMDQESYARHLDEDDLDALYSKAVNTVNEYEKQIEDVANVRFKLLYRSDSKKSKSKKKQEKLSREDKISAMDFNNQVIVTNPLGLFGETNIPRLTFARDIDDEEAIAKTCKYIVTNKSIISKRGLYLSWARQIGNLCTEFVEHIGKQDRECDIAYCFLKEYIDSVTLDETGDVPMQWGDF